MSTDFYNKVAKKFGAYHTGAKYVTEYPKGEPEKIFKEKLIELSGKEKTALDLGCADGRFTLSVASHFKQITAIDMSDGMLDAAKRFQKEKNVTNVSFEKQDAKKTTFPDESFDIVYSRRGPTPFAEIHRLLKPQAYFVGINIGEKDCQPIKELFGRGQDYGKWNESRLEKDKAKLELNGFEVIFAEDYFYDEYFASYNDLNIFLQGVPIFEDFDSEKDKLLLEEYTNKFKTEKGIKFPRHRIVIVAKKKSLSKISPKKYFLELNPRPFNAIKEERKKVEGRVPTSWDSTPYQKINAGDIICFTNNETDEIMDVEVRFVHHYKTLKEMLETEGVLNVSSSSTTIEGSIEGYHEILEYKENIPKFGIYAIGVKLISINESKK